MKVNRCDILLVQFPFNTGAGVKLRPAVVVQYDRGNARMATTIMAAITTNLSRLARTPTRIMINPATTEGQSSGLIAPSVVACENLATVATTRIVRRLGSLSLSLMKQVDDALKASLDLS